jgi:hypothetical protein
MGGACSVDGEIRMLTKFWMERLKGRALGRQGVDGSQRNRVRVCELDSTGSG